MKRITNKSELRQRYGFRKLASGMLVSGIIGAFFLVGGQSVQADTTNTAEPAAAVVETANKPEQEQTKETETLKVDTQVKTSSKEEVANTNTDVKQETAESTKGTKTTKTTTPVSTEVKDKADVKTEEKNAVDTKKAQASDIKLDQKQEAKVQAAETKDPVDVNIWEYSNVSDGITLNGLKGNPVVDGKIIVPNSYDFEQAGIITAGQKVYIDAYFRRNTDNGGNDIHDQYGNSGVTEFKFSRNGGGKVYAVGNWGDAFNGVQYKTMDLTSMDVSGVINATQMFCWTKLEKIIGLDTWDVSNFQSMGSMFYNSGDLVDIGDLSKWNTSKVTSLSGFLTFASKLTNIGDISSWDVHNVRDFHQAFARTGITNLNLSGWDLSNAENVDRMFTGIANSTEIDMCGAKLPTKTHFNMLDFSTNAPMVVYSDAGSALFDLNQAELNETFDQTMRTPISGGIGHQRTNYLTITYNDANGNKQVLGTIPLNFVFTDKNAIVNEMKEKTEKTPINDLVHEKLGNNINVSPNDFTTNSADGKLTLKHNFDNKSALRLVTDSYLVNLVGQEYTQQIIYKDKITGEEIKTVNISGNLSTSGSATISNVDIVKDINNNLPKNYRIVSGMPTSDITINSVNPAAITVIVTNTATLNVVYQDEQGVQVGTQTVDGKVGETSPLKLTVPDGYTAVDPLPTTYSFPNETNQLIIKVKKNTVPTPKPDTVTLKIVYRNIQNNEDVKIETISGKVGDTITLNITAPEGYEVVGQVPATYTFTDATDQELIVPVKPVEKQPDQGGGDDNNNDQNPPVDDNHDNSNNHEQPNTDNEKPAKPGEKHTEKGNNARIGKQVVHTDNQKPLVHSSDVERAKLPQTGTHNTSSVVAVLGGLGFLLGLAFLEKSRRKN